MTRNVDDSKQTDDLIVDFSKTFDKVNHNLLIHQVKHYGIRGKVNNWIESYLSGRSQADIVEGEKSTYLSVDSGVPQSSVLGPRVEPWGTPESRGRYVDVSPSTMTA